MENVAFNIKTERTFTFIRKYAWIVTLAVGVGGLFFPYLGLLVPPIIVALTTMAFFKGRYWCGNFCPHGSFFDQVMMPVSRNKFIPDILKTKPVIIFAFVFFSYRIGTSLYKIFQNLGVRPLPVSLGMIFSRTYLMVLIVGGGLSLLVAPRTWCQFCPMGSLEKMSHKLGKATGVADKYEEKITIESTDLCHECGNCARVCPMQIKPYMEFQENDSNQLDNQNCIRCRTCVENCPAGILSLQNAEPTLESVEEKDLDYYNKEVLATKIEKIKELRDGIKEFSFRLKSPANIDAEPGQFILVKVSDKHDMFKAYSIAGIEDGGSLIKISVMKVTQGYGTSIMFEEFEEGMEIELKGPMGHELIIDKNTEDILLVAGGIGITPFVPIVEDIVENPGKTKNVKLVYGVNKEDQFLYRDFFENMAEKSDVFEFIPVVAFDDEWEGEEGFVTNVMDKMNLDKYKIYMCGPGPMESAAESLLEEKDFELDKLYAETTG
ncbi:MAG: 4Fe-4S dicluster domain-containing protein [Bacillota bacterium]